MVLFYDPVNPIATVIYDAITPRFTAFLQLLEAYSDRAEVISSILNLYSYIAQHISPQDVSGKLPAVYYSEFSQLFYALGRVLTKSNADANQEASRKDELSDYLLIVYTMIDGLVMNTMVPDESADSIFTGMAQIVLPWTSLEMCQDITLCTKFMGLIAAIISFFPPNRFAGIPKLLD